MKGVDGKKDNKLYCENKTDSELIFVGLLPSTSQATGFVSFYLHRTQNPGLATMDPLLFVHKVYSNKSCFFLLIAKLLMQKYNKGRYLLSN